MKHGIICPATYLNDFAIKSNFHLILPHVLLKNSTYYNFYKERIREGDFVLLDNSIFELGTSLSGKELLDIAEDLKVSEVVAPEIWDDAEGTKKVVLDFVNLHRQRKSNISILAIAQGNSIEELITSFFLWNSYPYVHSIGLPFTLDFDVPGVSDNVKSLTLKRVLNRWYLIHRIDSFMRASSQTIIKPTHLMGLSDPVELQRYKKYYWIRSNDSSSAFVHGFNLIKYTDKGLPGEKISQKVDFDLDITLTEEQKSCILYNISTILDWIS